jgi:hypothetical protein
VRGPGREGELPGEWCCGSREDDSLTAVAMIWGNEI